MSYWLVRFAPHVTAFIIVAVVWPWFVAIRHRTWRAVSSAVSRAVKAVLTYFVVRADEIRAERKQSAPHGLVPPERLSGAGGADRKASGPSLKKENDASDLAGADPGT
ncbi:hypothetical protein FB563_6098 [Streptomyces puniciscabiei]|uniref:Uncharacterized protein n=1 Tax=Streptomyces puniciscabiei TaxID=164348 RepID=A0A542TGS4_9ACTN|nr:hypothetical protein [Streptomyces puniciscabiei]TQK86041.1 hypothetical protein FB563_6098 [Streptomyces puniciscabiei]